MPRLSWACAPAAGEFANVSGAPFDGPPLAETIGATPASATTTVTIIVTVMRRRCGLRELAADVRGWTMRAVRPGGLAFIAKLDLLCTEW
jgi:hypothetical protein